MALSSRKKPIGVSGKTQDRPRTRNSETIRFDNEEGALCAQTLSFSQREIWHYRVTKWFIMTHNLSLSFYNVATTEYLKKLQKVNISNNYNHTQTLKHIVPLYGIRVDLLGKMAGNKNVRR